MLMRSRKPSRRVLACLAMLMGLLARPAIADGPFLYFTVNPCRILDTRDVGQGPALQNGTTRNFTIQGLCGIPSGARAVSFNFTAIDSTGSGFLIAYPAGTALPVVSTLNLQQAGGTLSNGLIVPLGASTPDLSVNTTITGNGSVHLVIDVTGYFTP